MFVGVIQEVGQVKEKTIENNKINIYIQVNMLSKELEIGNEVNINGLSFVVNEVGENYFKGTGNLSIMVNENVENLEVETFIHGAMCLAISGRCILSGFYEGKSANRGACNQICRRRFKLINDQNQILETTDLG